MVTLLDINAHLNPDDEWEVPTSKPYRMMEGAIAKQASSSEPPLDDFEASRQALHGPGRGESSHWKRLHKRVA